MFGAALIGIAIAAPVVFFPILSSTSLIGKQSAGFYLLPTSQLLKPWGEQTAVKGRPVDAAMDSAGRVIAVLNTSSVDFFERSSGAVLGRVPIQVSSYTGIAFRPGDRELWISETTTRNDDIVVVDTSDLKAPVLAARIGLGGRAVPCGIAFSSDGRTAYVALSRNNSLAIVDAGARVVKKEIETGIAPFGVAAASRAGRVFVSNRGGRRAKPGDTTAPTSGSAAVTDPISGSTTTGTLTVIDMETLAARQVPVGLAPSGLALSPDQSRLAVANGHSDTVSILDTRTLATVTAPVPQFPQGYIGSQPIAASWAPDGKRLYVACGGTNAIVAMEPEGAREWKVAGALPSGWFPSAILTDPQGALHVVNIKGTGNTAGPNGAYNSKNYEGSIVTIPAPADAQLSAGLREVTAANAPRLAPSGGIANLPSLGIRHVFFIIKENRTYDQVFGDEKQANGDASLVMFGREVTPNHHALAEKYVLLDNFYTGGAISFDGHQWLMQSFVSDYTERAFAASPRGYAWNMADALTVAPTGFFWQSQGTHLVSGARNPSIRVYGEFCLPATFDPKTSTIVDINEEQLLDWPAYWKMYKDGSWRGRVGERAGVPAIAPYLDTKYPFNTTVIPDQMRADAFLDELHVMEKSGLAPEISVIAMTADHTNGTKPGSPTPRAMVADDDLALGRIVEGISHSRFWESSLVLVVEDDAQNGRDHVDGHRTVALAIGPRVRRAAVDSNFYTQCSLVRTIQEIFRIPPQTRFVAAARAMRSIFTAEPDLSPWRALPARIPLDEMNPRLSELKGDRLWAARQSLAMDWKEPDEAPAAVLNRVLDIEARYRAIQIHPSGTSAFSARSRMPRPRDTRR
jgi:YVTN family beta-propeller protein